MDKKILYVGLDVHKASISVTVAEEGRDGAVRFIGAIPNTPDDIAKLARRLAKDGSDLDFCYEAGCCGSCLHRRGTEPDRPQAGRADQDRLAGFPKAGAPASCRRSDAGMGARSDA